jgi:two-component system cell cycle response regulator
VARAGALAELAVESCSPEGLSRESCKARLLVLDATAFDALDRVRQRYEECRCPTLVLARRAQFDAILGWLRPDDDIALHDDPPELIARRIHHLDARYGQAHDSLTGLPLRQPFQDQLERVLPFASEPHPVSVILVDIDHFKQINDRHGHHAGDRILRDVSSVLERQLGGDSVAMSRYAGELFAIALRDSEREACKAAEGLRHEIATTAFGDGLRITASFGISSTAEELTVDQLMQDAQQAVYSAKAQGRDRVVSYGELVRRAAENDEDVALASFENLTRVVSERIVSTITRKGRKLFEEMREQADLDALTSVYSRRYLDRRLEHEFALAKAGNVPLTLALIDLDHFGSVNKRHGWPSGDRTLSEFATLLRAKVRDSDWVARYGGEEFCLVMPSTPPADGIYVCERLRQLAQEHEFFSTSGLPIPVTISVGISSRNDADQGVSSLIERISRLLLEAKRAGRNRVCSG